VLDVLAQRNFANFLSVNTLSFSVTQTRMGIAQRPCKFVILYGNCLHYNYVCPSQSLGPSYVAILAYSGTVWPNNYVSLSLSAIIVMEDCNEIRTTGWAKKDGHCIYIYYEIVQKMYK